MKARFLVAACAGAWLVPLAAATLQPGDFAWQAPLDLQAGATAGRVDLPAEALMQSRAPGLADLRVFNADGEAVAFALRRLPPVAAKPVLTTARAAYTLSRVAPAAPAPGARDVRIRVTGPGGDAVWVQVGPASTAAGPADARLPAALFDLRDESRPLAALQLEGELPANVPVRLSAATSTDLAQWTPLPLEGSLYRFEGAAPLENRTLRLAVPQPLTARYLRLDWSGQPGVSVTALAGVVAAAPGPARVSAPLPPPAAVQGGLEWPIDFATPVAALALSTPRANSVVPVRVLRRQDGPTVWQPLAQAVVFRTGLPGHESTNPAVPLGTSTTRLRVEPTQAPVADDTLAAAVEFDAVQVAFVATGRAPFRLAVGRPGTAAADLPLATLAAVLPPPDDLPAARLGTATLRPSRDASAWARLLPGGPAPTTAVLWAVLGLGVVMLAAVAWRLFAQLKPAP